MDAMDVLTYSYWLVLVLAVAWACYNRERDMRDSGDTGDLRERRDLRDLSDGVKLKTEL